MLNLSVPDNLLHNHLSPLLDQVKVPTELHPIIYHSIAFVVILGIAFIGFNVVNRLFSANISHLLTKTKSSLKDALERHHFFSRFSHTITAMVFGAAGNALYVQESTPLFIVDLIATVYFIIAITSVFNAILNTIHYNYNRSRYSKRVPIDGFIQVGKLVVISIAILLVAAKVLDKSPGLLLSGLGAITAVLLLVFKDTILGFVAGINIAANRTVNNGDWVEIPSYGADGTVLALGLTTVKIQNWDNTITSIPTYALMNEEVKNWRGMENSGGRRIKRAIWLDAQTVNIWNTEQQEQLKQKNLLAPPPFEEIAHESQTNIGLLRNYIHHYLKHHPLVNENLTLLVRQLQPTDLGIPIEVYCFSKEKSWAKYETLQAELIEHFIAVLPHFGLKMYQRISDRSEGIDR
ncbi:mechanosensitive ion channel family protein [Alteromonas sp. a30]|uniref:mechanosensitive ion channel family protein n=1 Tax=Alteromonas sp. a30 TaxID=2730917 RepID=UPI00227E1C79|nr:mechanosensitive ion channel domain-containing protein [Alteromonas sp. a30]MCY7294854.1 mechanosensitive ion channel [Alteromonas sp. a30]